MKKIVLTIVFAMLFQTNLVGQTLEDLRKTKKTSYLDFILLKIENRLVQRHSLLGTQPMAMRIQYQSVGSQVDFFEEDSKIVISIIGVMHEKRYKKKRYRPKISDCNILRNILLYGKYGYNLIFQKNNSNYTKKKLK